MKRFIFIIIALATALFAQSRWTYKLPATGYAARLVGVTGTRTAGDTVSGTYNQYLNRHVFDVIKSGYYKLQTDAAGGTNYVDYTYLNGTNGFYIATGDTIAGTVGAGSKWAPDGATITQSIVGSDTLITADTTNTMATRSMVYRTANDSNTVTVAGRQVNVLAHIEHNNFINVKDYGAVGDGLLADSVTNNHAFNKAFEDAYNYSAKKVIIPEGVYKIATYPGNNMDYRGLKCPPNIVIEGAGEGKTILQAVDKNHSLLYVNTSLMQSVDFSDRNVTVRNLTLIGTEENSFDPAVKTGGGAGVYIVGENSSNLLNNILFENVTVKYFYGEGFKNSNVYRVTYNNCSAIGNEFIGFDPGAIHTVLNKCYVDSVYEGMEYYGLTRSTNIDSFTTLIIEGSTFKNNYHEGINLLGGDYINISNSFVYGRDSGAAYGSANYGIDINPTYRETKELRINDIRIKGFGLYGFYSYSTGGKRLHNIIFDNVKISDTGKCSFFTNTTVDSIDRVWIENCKFTDYNQTSNTSYTASGIYAKGIHRLTLINNTVYTETTTSAGGSPVSVNNCPNAIIMDNDFRRTLSAPYMYFVNNSDVTSATILNNQGLAFRAIRNSAVYYPQQMVYRDGGFWLGDSVAFKFHIMNQDSLVATKYTNAGVAGTSTTIAK